MSLEQWAALPEGEQGELVDGALVDEEMAGSAHESTVTWLTTELRVWGRERGIVVQGSAAKYAVSPKRGRMPDVGVYLPGAGKPPRAGLIRVAPSIAVEVVSATPRDARRDRVEKLAEYAAFGVRWYWIVDPQTRTFEINELGSDGRYVHAAQAVGGRIESVPGCAGLSLDLDDLWRELDLLPDGDEV
jgi:Uma2 family endonuclease